MSRFAHDLDDREFRDLAQEIGLYDDVPIAEEVASGLHTPELSAELRYAAAYRGWYGNRWYPKQSKYGARGGRHKGADIAVAKGTPLPAIAGPAQIQWNPMGSGGKWGNHVFLNFRWNDGGNYTFVYAHLESLVGNAPREVSLGATICRSGCSGNAGGPGMYCGVDNVCGGRSDHLHLELFGPDGRIDPIRWLGWQLKYANDNRCVECKPKAREQ